MRAASIALTTLLVTSPLYAGQIHIHGTISQPLHTQNTQLNAQAQAFQLPKTIKLLNVSISEQLRRNLKAQAQKIQMGTMTQAMTVGKKTAVQLGMNGVPVFDQGQHGTCATFANTAAVDAVIKKGDYISQLCQLQYGNYLSDNGYYPSGWDGSLGPIVLNQMVQFGIINKKVEEQQGCGGLYAYPTYGSDSDGRMQPEQYHNFSEEVGDLYFSWSSILDINAVMFEEFQSTQTLDDVKHALTRGDRVSFGVLIFDFEKGTMGAVGTNHAKNDTWVLTPELIKDLSNDPMFGGHEMLITGFDDNAVAKDAEGREYKGLLTLRNSWGSGAGNKGDFYMSYDYFKTLVIEAQRIRGFN